MPLRCGLYRLVLFYAALAAFDAVTPLSLSAQEREGAEAGEVEEATEEFHRNSIAVFFGGATG